MAGVMLGCTGNVSKLCSPFRIVETVETAVPVQVMTFHVPILESLGVEPRGVSPSDLTPHKIVHKVPLGTALVFPPLSLMDINRSFDKARPGH